jgi:hypothetical protein
VASFPLQKYNTNSLSFCEVSTSKQQETQKPKVKEGKEEGRFAPSPWPSADFKL